jgi:SAM-dependent methyltransferase
VEPKRAAYWDRLANDWVEKRPQRLWRHYSDLVNARLLAEWLPPEKLERVLKTDAFDEAVGEVGLQPHLAAAARSVVGIDLSVSTLSRARARYPTLRAAGADVCRLPFDDGTFDLVFSNSTLDHMGSLDDVARGLAELHRVLRAGGQLLLTLDNLWNPVVALRNALPGDLLRRLRLVHYHLGVTCGPRRLRRMVGEAGFETRHVGALMHCPRLPAVWAAGALDRIGGAAVRDAFVRFLLAFEGLARWPTRYLTGYFVSVAAVRR